MNYADSLKGVLIRKINNAERDLAQLKLDYCRFVFGLTHRSKVVSHDRVYQVKSVDLQTMRRLETDDWTKPTLTGVVLDRDLKVVSDYPVELDADWVIYDEHAYRAETA